jgi:predicted heme/steroid binding protein
MKKILLLTAILLLAFSIVGCEQVSTFLNQNEEVVFTLDELAAYNGKDGNKGYTAVNGIVYDVTDEFPNGEHQGFQIAGIDSTAIFEASPHTMSMLGSLQVVGVLDTAVSQITDNTSQTTNTTNETTLPVFTLEELAVFNGQNGQKGYIAVDGVIYDVTTAFPNGMHQGLHLAGTDATAAFNSSPHARSILSGLLIVGSLEGSDPITTTETTTTTDLTQTEGYMPVFTLDQLSVYDGKNGQKVYVAVLGVVYDGTDEFYQGMHQGYQLGGIDATAIFQASPHAMSILNELPIVGSLEGYPLISVVDAQMHDEDDDNDYDDDDYDDDDHDDYDDDHDDDMYVSTTNLPQAILDYLNTNYPNIGIDEVEIEDGMYEIELDNDLELYFDLNGNFLSVEYDD